MDKYQCMNIGNMNIMVQKERPAALATDSKGNAGKKYKEFRRTVKMTKKIQADNE